MLPYRPTLELVIAVLVKRSMMGRSPVRTEALSVMLDGPTSACWTLQFFWCSVSSKPLVPKR
jgi:hypothetical protein